MSRELVELAHVPDIVPSPVEALGWPAGASVTVLSEDADTGAVTGVLSAPVGWRRQPGYVVGNCELFVLGGTLRIGETLRGFGYYEFAPGGSQQQSWVVEESCSLLLMARGAPEHIAGAGRSSEGRIERDTGQMPWTETTIEGHPPGVAMKILRTVEETGETVLLESIVRRWDYPVLEYHACAEELFLIEGDMWLSNSGTMRPGSYLWRPAYYTHGPFYTRTGALILAWLEAAVESRYADDPRSTPEQNRAAEARRERAQPAGS